MYVYFRKNMHTYICTHLRRYTHVCVCVFVFVCKLCTKTYNNILVSYKRRRRNFQLVE